MDTCIISMGSQYNSERPIRTRVCPMSRESFVDYSKDGAIVTVCLKRPEARNALGDLEDCRDLIASFERAEADLTVSVLILTGSGTAFSAGGNLKNMRE